LLGRLEDSRAGVKNVPQRLIKAYLCRAA